MAQEKAIGILETRGMAALVAALDAMLKVTDVQICGWHGIGSGWVTVVIEGGISEVQVAIGVGRQEAKIYGDLIFSEVVSRAEDRTMELMPHRTNNSEKLFENDQALGLLETSGLIPLIEGADSMVKTAAININGWASIGGALTHLVVRGDLASVQASLSAGRSAAENAGNIISTLLIPKPAKGIELLLPSIALSNVSELLVVEALGIIETTGYAAAVGGCDGMVKSSEVKIMCMILASGGRVTSLVTGDLDGVQAAVAAGVVSAKAAGELNSSHVISNPAPEAVTCFVRDISSTRVLGEGSRALGLIETRSTVALVKAVDGMLKTAQVEYEGSYKVGSFLTASVIRGDIGAVRTALEVGKIEASKYGELVSANLIPNPLPEMEKHLVHR